MSCIYIYNNRKFDSEESLNDFLLQNKKLISKYGDIVFEKSSIHNHVIDILNTISEDSRELQDKYRQANSQNFGEEQDKKLEKPYTGVIEFLSKLRDKNGQRLFPEFIPDEYWSRRFAAWKSGDFTDDEKELFFENTSDIKPITDETLYQNMRNEMEEKWNKQAEIGTELHKILQSFFSTIKSGTNAGKLVGSMPDDFLLNIYLPNKINSELVSYKAMKDTLQIAKELYNQITQLYGENCTFYPEFIISNKTTKSIEGDKDIILGMIDLLVVDEKGNAHIFDYKTSPKPYSKYSSAKELAYTYQIAVYNRILEKYGINVDNSDMSVIPLQMVNFRKENGEFIYDGVKPMQESSINSNGEKISPILFKSLKDRIELSWKIQSHIEEFLPIEYNKDPVLEDATKNIRDQMNKFFPNYYANDFEEIKKELEEAGALKPNDNGIRIYKIGNKELTGKSEIELINEVKQHKEKLKAYNIKTTTFIINSLKEGIKNEDPNIILPRISETNPDINPNWLREKLYKYCNHTWKILENDISTQFGIIILQNQITGQLDFLKISSFAPNVQKHFGGKDRYGLSGAFEADLVQQSKSNSKMLQAYQGNVDLIETMLVINNIQSCINKKSIIGNIEVINPYYGRGVSASNEELLYTFNTLVQLSDQKYNEHYTNRFQSGELKLANNFQLALNKFTDIMTLGKDKSWAGDFKEFKQFETCLSMLDASMDETVQQKIDALDNLRIQLEKQWNLESGSTDVSQINSKQRSLYNSVLIALAELRGITFRQQVKENSKWLESFIINKKGISGLYVDNPGNLNSETLNLLTKLVTEAYQNVRQSMSKPRAEIRRLVENLKKDKDFGFIKEHTVGNQASLYSNMIYVDQNGDLLFKNINDPSLLPSEREFLKYALRVINKNRFPTSDLNQMEQSNDVRYYRVPLARGDFSSYVSTDGLLSAFKDKLKELNPKVLLERQKDKLEGINRIEESEGVDKAAGLFEIGVGFDRGEKEDRINYIKKMGDNYFEKNIETLLLKHIFQYSVKTNMDKVFPMMKAAMAHLSIQGANANKPGSFNNDITYLKEYIQNKIKNESIVDKKYEYANTLIGEVKQAASFAILAFSPVQAIYQSLQGLWNDIRLILMKPDIIEKHGKSAFTFKNMKESFIEVYKDLGHFGNSPTMCSLINELYGINDMDMNQYVDRLKSDQHGFFNFTKFAFSFSSRPDYYNRMTIFVAQMKNDGCWKAHSIQNGELVYNWEEDERFKIFAQGLTNHPDYAKQKGLYYAMAKQFVNEHAKYADGTDFVLDLNNPKPLPRAYTTLQSESYKSLCDDIYGYYTHEKKSLMHSMLIGSMFMQFKTFWTGKKNQYLAKGGVKLRGNWVQQEIDGKPAFYKIDSNGNVLNEITTENTGVPVFVWKGQWQEGIFITLSDIFSPNPKTMWKNLIEKWYNEDPMLRNVYRSNLKQFIYDMTMWIIGGVIIAAIMGDWLKELKEDLKDSIELSDSVKLAAANVLTMSVKNSFLDFNFHGSLIEPVTSWNALSLDWGKRTLKNIFEVAFGDKTIWDGVVNTSSALRQIKPGLDIIKPKQEEE